MKKIVFFGIIALSIAFTNTKVEAAFTRNLSVGSTGADVSELQTWLMSKGFDIPDISSKKSNPGYFGRQTKNAVIAYQKSVKLPTSGFFGPLTRDTIAKAKTVPLMTATLFNTPYIPQAQGTISTPGVVGTLAASLWSTPSGIVAYKGQAYDIVSYKVQASASDMSLQNLTLDFDVRLWLYANSVTIKDDTGAVVGQVNNLNSSNFSELTAGSQYRLSVPVNGYVVRATQIKYLTVNIGFLSTSDRSTGTLTVTQSQIRSVDGTGVTDTATVTDDRTFTYQGSGGTQIIATISSSTPPQGFIEISSSDITKDAILAIYSIKSQNKPAYLRSLVVRVGILSNGNSAGTIPALFSAITLKIGGRVVSTGSIGAVTTSGDYRHASVTFNDINERLAADVFTDLSVGGNIAIDSGSKFEGIVATTTLDLTNTNNIVIDDESFNHLTPNSISITSNAQQFTESNVLLSGMPTLTYGKASIVGSAGTTTQKFIITIPLMAGKNAIYIPKNIYTALSTSTNPTDIAVSGIDWSDDDTNGDGSTYFYMAPGQAKTFTATYNAVGLSTVTGTIRLEVLNYGTDSSASGGYLTSPEISNILTAVLFH